VDRRRSGIKGREIRRWVFAWAPLIGYAALMFYFSSRSSLPKFLPSFYLSDKLMHGIEYAIFGALVFHAIQDSPKPPETGKKVIILSILLVILYGISDETHQYYVPNRDASFYDLIADVVGGCVGIFAALSLKNRWNRERRLQNVHHEREGLP